MLKSRGKRERIMDIAESSILSKGFSATSIEEIAAEAEMTKSGFFYHFKDKNELALALLKRFIENDTQYLNKIFNQASEQEDDPLNSFLIGLDLMAKAMRGKSQVHAGSVLAALCYVERVVDQEVRDMYRHAMLGWRARFTKMFKDIQEHYPMRDAVSTEVLADTVYTTIEGGIILSRSTGEPDILAEQIILMRSYLQLLFKTG